MKDGVIKQDGTSRSMRATFPSTYEEFRTMAANGTLTMDILFNAAGWQQLPTFLNKANLLKDTTAALFGMDNTAVPDDVFECLSHITPTGAVFWIARETAPDGYLICDGSSVSRTEYQALFNVIGTKFGSNDSTTFKLPDLRAKFIRGAGTSNSYSATFGATQEATAEIPKAMIAPLNYDKEGSYGTGSYVNGGDTGSATSKQTYSMRPYNIALTPIIKYM